MKKTLTTVFAVSLALLVLGQTALAIPAFARKHAFNCNMCHVGFPKLNDFGQRFRDNGYQIPGQQGLEKTVFESAIPLAMRTTTGYSLYGTGGETAGGFHVFNLDLLSGGVLNKNISYLFIYTPRIDEPAADFTGPGTGDNPAQLAAIESAAVVFSNIVRDKLNLRIGRFEPGFQLLSSKRNYYVLQPYEIYNFAAQSFVPMSDASEMSETMMRKKYDGRATPERPEGGARRQHAAKRARFERPGDFRDATGEH